MPSALNVSAWQTTAASNSGADSTIGTIADTSSPTVVDDWVRSIMAAIRRYTLDTDGGLTAGGTADAITLTTNRNISSGHQAAGFSLRFIASATNTGATTVAVDGLSAVNVKRLNGDALSAGDIVNGGVYDIVFVSSVYILLGSGPGAGTYGTLSGDNTWSGSNTFTGSVTVGDGSGDAVTVKGTLLSAYMSGLFSTSSASAFRTAIGTPTGTSGTVLGFLDGSNTWSSVNIFARDGSNVIGNLPIRVQRLDSAPTTALELIDFYYEAAGSQGQRGSVVLAPGGVSYSTTSDGGLKPKEHRRPILDSGAIIDALEPLYFRWNTGEEDFGYIAQDAHAVHPLLATPGSGSPGDEDFIPWKMERGRMEAFHTAELQSLRRRVAALEVRV